MAHLMLIFLKNILKFFCYLQHVCSHLAAVSIRSLVLFSAHRCRLLAAFSNTPFSETCLLQLFVARA